MNEVLTCDHCNKRFLDASYPARGHKMWWPTGNDLVDCPPQDPERYFRQDGATGELIMLWYLCDRCARDPHSWPYWAFFGFESDELQLIQSRYCEAGPGNCCN